MMTMTEKIAVDDHAAAATIATAPAVPHTNAIADAARTAPESTDKGLSDSLGADPGPALGHRVPDRTLRLQPISRRSLGTDTRALTHDQPLDPAHDPAPGPAVNLEAVKGNWLRSFLNMNVTSY